MSHNVPVLVLGFGLLGFAASTPAHALALDQTIVHVPYAFRVLDKTLPAGDYVIAPASPEATVLLLWSKDGRSAAMVPVEDVVPSARERSKAQLVFDAYGKERFLRTLSFGELGEVSLPVTRNEVVAARQMASLPGSIHLKTASASR